MTKSQRSVKSQRESKIKVSKVELFTFVSLDLYRLHHIALSSLLESLGRNVDSVITARCVSPLATSFHVKPHSTWIVTSRFVIPRAVNDYDHRHVLSVNGIAQALRHDGSGSILTRVTDCGFCVALTDLSPVSSLSFGRYSCKQGMERLRTETVEEDSTAWMELGGGGREADI